MLQTAGNCAQAEGNKNKVSNKVTTIADSGLYSVSVHRFRVTVLIKL